MNQILLVEDSPEYQLMAQEALGSYFQLIIVDRVEKAIEALELNKVELVLLDLSLPTQDGYSLLAKLQSSEKTSDIPVMCITSRSQVADKVAAFSLGVDDYIVKPYNLIELKARVEAKLRKQKRRTEQNEILIHGDLRINCDLHQVMVQNTPEGATEVHLTPIEFRLLTRLVRQPGKVFTRNELMIAVWGNDASVFDRTVDVHIWSLRKKLGSLGHYIVSVSGVGYKSLVRPATQKPQVAL